MRIGVISYDYSPPIGGLGVMLITLLSALRQKKEHHYTVLSPSHNADDRVSAFASSRWKKKGGCPLFSVMCSLFVERIIARHQLALLHVHAGSGGVFLLRKPSIPLLVTAHHTYEQERKEVFARWSIAWMTKWLMAKLERRTYQLADCITCVSGDTRQALIEDYAIDPQKICVIENAIADDFLCSLLPKRTSPIRQMLFLGRIEERKGIWTLLFAFSCIIKTHPNLSLILAGKNLLGDDVIRWIQENNCTKNVFILDAVSEEKKKELLDTSDVLIIPSTLEGFGLIAIEGMARGIPIVASNCAGLRSVIQNGKTGMLFESRRSDDLVRVLEEIITHGIDPSLIEAAYHEVCTRFSLKRQVMEYERQYQRIAVSE